MIDAVIFDKDGTLFDFQASWGAWARKMLTDLAQGDQMLLHRLAECLRFDLKMTRFHPDSFVIADTPDAIALALADELPHREAPDLLDQINEAAARVELVEAAPLVPLILDLQSRGLMIGVVTNDAEAPARAHLSGAGVVDAFDIIVGFDSGYGAKPAPDPLLACAKAMGVEPARSLMVGDSTHDLVAGRAAGMSTMGVLTGPAETAELNPYADVVLPHIGYLPAWLDRQ